MLPRDKTAVVWDKDSTLANTSQRLHIIPLIKEGKATWDDYSMACETDEPIPGSVRLLKLLHPYHRQIVISGASEASRSLVNDWFWRNGIPVDGLELRLPDEITVENAELKVRKVRKLQAAGIDVVLAVEDYQPAAELIYKETGVPVLGLNPFYGYAEDAPRQSEIVLGAGVNTA